MAVASFVISVLAFLVAGAALWYSHRQAVAAERSADADQRSITLAEAEAAKYAPPWDLRWEAGDTYLLTNGSDEPTLEVKLDLGDIPVARGELEHTRIGPGSAVKFLAGRTMGTTNDTVTVTWRRFPDGPILDWQHPLPAKPRLR
jgi:hypothetical protein